MVGPTGTVLYVASVLAGMVLDQIVSRVRSYFDTVRATRLDTPELVLLAIARDYEDEYGEPITFKTLKEYAVVVGPEYFAEWSVYDMIDHQDWLISNEFTDWVLSMVSKEYLDREDGPHRVHLSVTDRSERVLDLVESKGASLDVYELIDEGRLSEVARQAARSNQ
jgi:hypothetical protein